MQNVFLKLYASPAFVKEGFEQQGRVNKNVCVEAEAGIQTKESFAITASRLKLLHFRYVESLAETRS